MTQLYTLLFKGKFFGGNLYKDHIDATDLHNLLFASKNAKNDLSVFVDILQLTHRYE